MLAKVEMGLESLEEFDKNLLFSALALKDVGVLGGVVGVLDIIDLKHA